ncbi:hypothetical protein ACH5RR_040036 [Cinchona calisaya]|uniref:DUF868 domain-containing protein n=1 Tax=Cinchona calisaya TaxID=153742 RepID=A0ABD2XT85_9GENT
MPRPHRHSSPFPACFRPTNTNITTAPPPRISANPNLTTSLYDTELGLFGLTWSRNLFGRSLHIHLLLLENSADVDDYNLSFPAATTPAFHLEIKPFTFWKKRGSKPLVLNGGKTARVYWDLSRAKFGSRPNPLSGFYIAIVVAGEMRLLVGDSSREAYASSRATTPDKNQIMVLRREHVYGNPKLYTTKVKFAGKEETDVSIDYRLAGDDPRLYFSIDNKRVLQIKHLRWKFRGNERVEVDGVPILISWDVHSWLFDDDEDGYALFMFKFEKLEDDYFNLEKNGFGFGFETNKMRKGLKLLRSGRSSSSSSLSSAASSSSCSSVMEWASVEENELKGPSGFSLVVYAWKS